MSDLEFRPFPKIARFMRDVILTEKIDGTNASIIIDRVSSQDLEEQSDSTMVQKVKYLVDLVTRGDAVSVYDSSQDAQYYLRAGSRTRFIRPGSDNFAFAKWVWDNAQSLYRLGQGTHFGEWWGKGIQRGYGVSERYFSLFNVTRWADAEDLPPVCRVVPVLYSGPLFMQGGENAVDFAMRRLTFAGSEAAPGFKPPEGIVLYHTHGNNLYKVTTEGDGHKGQAA